MSMFDLLKQLPVFQGISTEQLTDIIEKIPFHFQHYEAGETILQKDDECENVTFVLTGSVRVTTPTYMDRIRIEQIFESPYTIPFYNLFGAETRIHDHVVSMGHTGIMQLDKLNFLRVLQQNKILLINVLNMLSTHAQKQHLTMNYTAESDPVLRLSSWLLALSERSASEISMIVKSSDWCQMLQLEEQVFWRSVAALEGLKIVELEGERLKLLDRYALRTFVGNKTAHNS